VPLPRISEYTAVTAELLCIYRNTAPSGRTAPYVMLHRVIRD